jgi:hypothetical protein
MRKIALPYHILVAVAAICLLAAPAHAQATRTWVSGVGDDANPCSRTAPCKTFAGAISKTATFGEIDVLDPGGFGALTITKSISIVAIGVDAGVLVSGSNGINVVVNPGDKVVLEGLNFEGQNLGLNGVNITGGGRTTIRNCRFRNFTQNAVNVAGTDGARAVIEDSMLVNNAGGLNVVGPSGGANFAVLERTLVDSNSAYATQTTGATSALVLIGSTLSGSPLAIISNSGAAVISYGNNVIRGTGLPTQTIPLQ